MTESERPWVPTPTLADVPVNHGTGGKNAVTGVVSVRFLGGEVVYIETKAHHNDNAPALTYRGHEWLASAHLTRQPDGTWTEQDPVSHGVSRRGLIGYGKNTPPTYRAAIIAALCATVADVWTPDLERQGNYATAAQTLRGLLPDRVKAAESLAELDRRIAALRATLAETADPA